MKKVKVAQFGLGPIGLESLRLAAAQPWMEIVGAADNDPAKAGRPLAEMTGLGSLDGLSVAPSLEEIFRDTQPDVILHTATSRARATLEQMRPALEVGVSVATTCEELVFPRLRVPDLFEEYHALCRHTGARLVATGVNPGFVMDLLPIGLTGVCRAVDHIRVERVVNATTRRRPLQAKIGSGQEAAAFRAKLQSGAAGHAGLRESLALVAHAMAWTLDEIREQSEPVVADRKLATEFFTVAAGQVCGVHQRVVGSVGPVEKISLELRMYLEALAPHDTIVISGRPGLHVTIAGGVAGDDATVASLINVVPRLLAAAPGLRLLTELAVPSFVGPAA
ncbi:MAG: dihydrodipicolinate reductase [Opitutae bacterium]|nr:dihydrodipicolinate reductase [Opitutae bacterium]